MPVPSQEATPEMVVVQQCQGENDLFCPPLLKHRPNAGSDSGCDPEECTDESKDPVIAAADEAPFELPDDDLASQIVAEVEFYFSDENITKDVFLLKHVKRNQGYVSLKLISSFRRVKRLARDWRAVAYALEKSATLQVNEARTRVRRTSPIPQYDETARSRTKRKSKGAAAVRKDNQLLHPQSQMLSVQPKTEGNERINARPSSEPVAAMGDGADAEERPAESSRMRWSGPLERLLHRRTSNPSCNNSARLQRHKTLCESSPGEGGSSPWVQRRMAAASMHTRPGALQPRPRTNSGALTGTLFLPPNVVRMPRGPDGTRGFRFVRR